jgi:hypothetical protein
VCQSAPVDPTTERMKMDTADGLLSLVTETSGDVVQIHGDDAGQSELLYVETGTGVEPCDDRE